MEKSIISELEFQLRKLMMKNIDLFDYYQWPSEHDRWIELIFALVTRISKKNEDEIRHTIDELDVLDLLDVEDLSQIPEANEGINFEYAHARRVVEYLSESGFTEEESKNCILVMHEAAKSLKIYNDGKIQKYLRKYGQQMITEITQNFSFSKMDERDVKFAFTYWLQNVLNMPISLDDDVKEFCKKIGKKPKDLVEIADKLNINLAIVDDIVRLHETEVTNQITAEENKLPEYQ